MNTETIDKVAEVIDGLCEKLGTTAQYLIPELAKAYTASCIYNVIVWGIVTLASGILAFVFCKKYTEDEFESGYMIISLILLCVAVVGFLIFVSNGDGLVAWIASPTAKAFMVIMGKLK